MPLNSIPWTGGLFWENTYVGNLITNRDTSKFKTRYSGSSLFVTGINSSINSSEIWSINVSTYDGVSWSSFTNGGNYSVDDVVLIDISPFALNAYLGISKITSSTKKYQASIIRSGSPIIVCEVDIICESRYQPIPLVFLNSSGGYDTMYFELVNKQTRTNEKKQFDSVEWQYDSTTTSMQRYDSTGKFYGGSNTFFIEQSITYHLISDYVNYVDYYWLKDLINSPEVYIYSGGYYLPITISTNNWTEKLRRVDKLYNLEIDIKLGSKVNSQFR